MIMIINIKIPIGLMNQYVQENILHQHMQYKVEVKKKKILNF